MDASCGDNVLELGVPHCFAWIENSCPVQVDLLDLMYRCARHGSLPSTYLAALSPLVRSFLLIIANGLFSEV